MKTIKFWLDGCDISFVAEAPENITLKQLLMQCDRIKPDWCACGIRTAGGDDEVDLIITHDSIVKARDCSCKIKEV